MKKLSFLILSLACFIQSVAGQDQLIFSDTQNDRIYVANLDGSGSPQVLVDNATGETAGPTGLFYDAVNDLLYINNGNERETYVISSDGMTPITGPASFLPNSNPPSGEHFAIQVDLPNNRYFFCTDNSNGIWVANTDGSGTSQAVITTGTSIDNGSGMDYNATTNTVVAGSNESNNIVSVDVSTGVSTLLFDNEDGVSGPRGLRIDKSGGRIFWAQHTGGNNGSGKIMVGNLDGSGTPSMLYDVPAPYLPYDVLVDERNDHIYWSEFNRSSGSRVMKGNLDGSSSPVVLHNMSTTGYMRGLAFANISAIPTLSQWGLFLFGLLIVSLGLITVFNLNSIKTV